MTSFANAILAHTMLREGQVKALFKMNVTPHFTWGEMLSASTQGVNRNDNYLELRNHTVGPAGLNRLTSLVKLAEKLEHVRTNFDNRRVTVTSALRTPEHQARVSRATASQHPLGRGADIQIEGVSPRRVQTILERRWKGGMGYGLTFTHLDTRDGHARFSY